MAYMGPPACSPRSSFSRKWTASTTSQYLVAMPTRAVHHIQNGSRAADGDGGISPAMLPVPTVAARQVDPAPRTG